MSIKSRLRKLEGTKGENKTVLVYVPRDWEEEMSEEAFNRIVADNAIEGPVDSWIQPDNTAAEARLGFVGNIQELFAEIARNSTRIGVTPKNHKKTEETGK